MGKQVKKKIIDLKKCTRCGKRHKNLEIHRFERPCLFFDFFGTCPETKEPILIIFKVLPDDMESIWVGNH